MFHEKVIVKDQLQEVYKQIIQEGMNEETFSSQKNLQDQWEELSSREECIGGKNLENYGFRMGIEILSFSII